MSDKKKQVDQPRPDTFNKAYQLCKEYLWGPWTQINPNELKVTTLEGGLTNKIFVCALPSRYDSGDPDRNYPTRVLLREYGLIIQDFKAQIKESVVFSILAERGIGPQLYAVFSDGRLEEYLPCHPLNTDDLSDPATSRSVAERVAEYHRLIMPVKKDPTFLMGKLLEYLEKAKTSSFQDPLKQSLLETITKRNLSAEVDYLRNMISRMNPVVVFCHNDVQEGNLLCSDDNDRANPLHMIDFEYSSYNYRGFDIANHFCEWTYNYSNPQWPFYLSKPENFPNEHQQRNFVDAYLDSMCKAVPSRKNDPRWSAEFVLGEVDRLVLFSHLFWALWSIEQAQISEINFGYLEYGQARLDGYFEHKKRFR